MFCFEKIFKTMPNIYLRVPHYVASYLRNRNRSDVIDVGAPVQLNRSERIWIELCEGMCPNLNWAVNRSHCFSQRQWSVMMDGYSLADGGRRKTLLLPEKADSLTLSDREVMTLSGLPAPRGDESGEYICIPLPREAVRYGRLVPVNSSWYLRDSSANTVRNLLTDEFWRTLYAYVDKAMDRCGNSGRKFVFIEALESFMERYNIRCSPDMKERDTLKRNYNRRRKSYRFTGEDYIEHG